MPNGRLSPTPMLMTSLPPVSLKIRRSILIIELFALAFSIWCNMGSPHLQRSPFKIELISLLVITIAPFIAIVPVDRPLWQRRIYIIMAILTVIVAEHFQVFTYLFYSTFLLKGCFLLPRRENTVIAVFFLIIATCSYTIRAPQLIENLLDGDMRSYLNLSRMIPSYLASNLGNCIYVLLLGSIWTEEQKSRQKADRLTKQVETLATDLERNRIARDIHDTLGHSLTSLDVQIELAQRLQAIEPERAQQSIDLAKKLSSQALDNVRQALGTMKRSNFDLTEAIVALAEQNHPFQVIVDVHFPQLSLQSSYQLYCVIQESITNIQKHAQAERVTIESRIVDRGTMLEICDNGNGFDLDPPHAGFGLRNMKERVQCLGGEFHLTSKIRQGTQIKIFVPS
jgi:signal transduction histidine kinase